MRFHHPENDRSFDLFEDVRHHFSECFPRIEQRFGASRTPLFDFLGEEMEELHNHLIGLIVGKLHKSDEPLESFPDLSLDDGIGGARLDQPLVLHLKNTD